SLLETFDEIYILNLHGSSKKQEASPDGTKDDNVFDITVGVAIALFVKLPSGARKERPIPHPASSSASPRTGAARPEAVSLPAGAKANETTKPHATVHRADLWGLRKHKYLWLGGHNAATTEWI